MCLPAGTGGQHYGKFWGCAKLESVESTRKSKGRPIKVGGWRRGGLNANSKPGSFEQPGYGYPGNVAIKQANRTIAQTKASAVSALYTALDGAAQRPFQRRQLLTTCHEVLQLLWRNLPALSCA